MRPIIALDGDGVLLDFHDAYRHAWHKAFGELPALRDPQAYWPIDRWDVRRLNGEELLHFRKHFDLEFWSTIPAIPGSIDACFSLKDAGFDLVCVTALDTKFQSARLQNLQNCGFPIERVVATQSIDSEISPKAGALKILKPVAFVDDYLPYMRGISSDIHTALVLREPNGSPNSGIDIDFVHSRHTDLAAFAAWWLSPLGGLLERRTGERTVSTFQY